MSSQTYRHRFRLLALRESSRESGFKPFGINATMHRYVWLYNQQVPQSALGSKTPLQAMKDWYKLKPELFKKNPYYLTGCDT